MPCRLATSSVKTWDPLCELAPFQKKSIYARYLVIGQLLCRLSISLMGHSKYLLNPSLEVVYYNRYYNHQWLLVPVTANIFARSLATPNESHLPAAYCLLHACFCLAIHRPNSRAFLLNHLAHKHHHLPLATTQHQHNTHTHTHTTQHNTEPYIRRR